MAKSIEVISVIELYRKNIYYISCITPGDFCRLLRHLLIFQKGPIRCRAKIWSGFTDIYLIVPSYDSQPACP